MTIISLIDRKQKDHLWTEYYNLVAKNLSLIEEVEKNEQKIIELELLLHNED